MTHSPTAPRPVQIEEGVHRQTLAWEGEPALELELRWPRLPEQTPALRRINRYYRKTVQQWRERWQTDLLRQAGVSLQAARQASRPFTPWQAELTWRVTWQGDGLLSLYADAVEQTPGRRPFTVRRGDTWELASGTPCTLPSLFPPHTPWRRQILAAVEKQIRAALAAGESSFYEGWEKRLVTCFDPDRFYLTEDQICVFYPLFSIAPFAEGIPCFSLPRPDRPAGETAKKQIKIWKRNHFNFKKCKIFSCKGEANRI